MVTPERRCHPASGAGALDIDPPHGGLFGRLSTNALSRAMQFAFEVTWLPAGASSDTVRLALVGHYDLFGLNLEFMTAPPSRGWSSWEQFWSLSLTAGLNVSW